MLGHGFSSEIAQNKNMAASFDGILSNDRPKSPSVQQLSSISTNSTNPNENAIGKKVKNHSSINNDI